MGGEEGNGIVPPKGELTSGGEMSRSEINESCGGMSNLRHESKDVFREPQPGTTKRGEVSGIECAACAS